MHLGRIEFNIVLFMDWSFASGCSPPRISTTQLPSATDRPVFPSGKDFHPSVGAYFQAHLSQALRCQATIAPSLRDVSKKRSIGYVGLSHWISNTPWEPL